MRLIDADELIQEFYNTCIRIEETDNNFQDNKEYITLSNVMDRVNAQPTALNTEDLVRFKQHEDLEMLRLVTTTEWADLRGENSQETLVKAFVDQVIKAIRKGKNNE